MNNTDDLTFVKEANERTDQVYAALNNLVSVGTDQSDVIRRRLIVGKLKRLIDVIGKNIQALNQTRSWVATWNDLNDQQQKMILTLNEAPEGLTAYAVSKKLDIPTSTAYRHLKALCDLDLVASSDGKYFVPTGDEVTR